MDAASLTSVQWISWLGLTAIASLIILHMLAREIELAAARTKLRNEVIQLRAQQHARMEALRRSLSGEPEELVTEFIEPSETADQSALRAAA